MTDLRKNRIPELDGLRVLMIAIVSWYHIWQQSWLFPGLRVSSGAAKWLYRTLGVDISLAWLPSTGYIWVDGTILLSVFLLYLPWAEAKRKNLPAPSAGDFWFRRARRILPAYYFILLCHLLLIALPWKQYGGNLPWMVKDIATHLTFTFNRYEETYIATPLGGAAWTLAVLVQGYLLFPLMARGVRKHPVITLCGMLAACFAYRAYVAWSVNSQYEQFGIMPNYSMTVNQLINFLDVYVIGVLCATAFDSVRGAREKLRRRSRSRRRDRYLRQGAMTLAFFASLYGLVRLLQIQARANEYELQAWQMTYRPLFALCFAGMIVTAPFALWPLRKLLGNPVTRFLAGISMNYYLIHQTVAVHLKYRLMIPWTESYLSDDFLVDGLYPNQVNDAAWQGQYVWLAAGVSLVMAIAVTYLVEKPGAKLFDRIREKIRSRKNCPNEVKPSP